MTLDIVSLIAIMGIPSAVTGFFFWLLKRYIDKRDEQRDSKDKDREKHDILLRNKRIEYQKARGLQ